MEDKQYLDCEICKNIPDECSSNEGLKGLPGEVWRLETMSGDESNIAGGGVPNYFTKKCPKCGTLYEYTYEWELGAPATEFCRLKRIEK